jgi:DNA primase
LIKTGFLSGTGGFSFLAFIPEDTITDIRNAADIVDIVSESVLLKKAGKDYKGLCPFHSEKTPSFTVSPEKQLFYCFGCGTGGNVFTFLMNQEGLSYPEAVRTLARRYQIDIPVQDMSPEQRQLMQEREYLFSINKAAMDFFCHTLSGQPAGEAPMAYLNKRGLTKEMIDAFNIGYDPPGRDNFVNYCSEKGISHRLAEKAGVIASTREGRFYDRFWGRIVFPIFDTGLRVIGFGGRVTDDANPERPKYINSPDTPLYNKSRSLYGLHRARQKCRQRGLVYLVEGYLDVLSLHQHGIENAVAILGTSVTSAHVRILKGHAGKVILVYDSDDAGIRAAQRSIEIFRKEEMDARILVLPSGDDPDSFLFKFGSDAFISAAEKALSALSFLTDIAVKKHGLSVEGKLRIISEMTAPLASVHDPVAQSLYIKELAEVTGVDDAAIFGRVASAGKHRKYPRPVTGRPASQKKNRLEKQIISMMLQFPEILSEIRHRNLLEYFEDDALKSIARTVLEQCDSPDIRVSEMIASIDGKENRDIATALAMKEEIWDRAGCLKLIGQFESSRKHNKDILFREIKEAQECNNDELFFKLLELEKKQNQDRMRQSTGRFRKDSDLKKAESLRESGGKNI